MGAKRQITDKQLLAWILDGTLRITGFRLRQPICEFRGRKLKPQLVYCNGTGREPCNPRYSWRICNGCNRRGRRRQRRVMCAKLVFMAYHRRKLKPFHQVHHKDLDRFNESAKNLVEKDKDAHLSAHLEAIYGKF